jgi:hypothetical protein
MHHSTVRAFNRTPLLLHDPLLDHIRMLRQARDLGEISEDDYRAFYAAVAATADTTILCANGDGRLATARIGERPICSACWVAERGGAK